MGENGNLYDEGEMYLYMNNFLFNFKANWYKNGKIKEIGFESFFLYLNMRKYELRKNCTLGCISVNLMYDEISKYHLSNGRRYTRPEIKKKLLDLRKNNVIQFEGRLDDHGQLLLIEFLDIPQLDSNYKPLTENDHFIIVETKFLDTIIENGLKEEHLILYLYLKTFHKEIRPSYETIGNMLGISKNTANNYGKQLEQFKIIANVKDKAQTGHIQNKFIVPTVKNYDQFVDQFEQHFTKLEIEKVKKKLKNNKIKVTEKAYNDVRYLFKHLTKEEKDELNKRRKEHVVFAISYLYFELLDELKMRENINI